ncbi:hypothetical protein CEXT_483571 [Caerostris extrusa]|uniref:Uncharacterized protein n=1 Tax=Caerostris extrusa TaxID=172846 RepID=A0AAV4VGA4_CAEEX|nr:hypothetical protein CEXT_483571 [Caerostris extrusa]
MCRPESRVQNKKRYFICRDYRRYFICREDTSYAETTEDTSYAETTEDTSYAETEDTSYAETTEDTSYAETTEDTSCRDYRRYQWRTWIMVTKRWGPSLPIRLARMIVLLVEIQVMKPRLLKKCRNIM